MEDGGARGRRKGLAKNGDYRAEVRAALENAFLGDSLGRFASDYRKSRAAAFAGLDEARLIAAVAAARDEALGRMDELFERFRDEAEKRGVRVHLAADGAAATALIRRLAREAGVRRVIKSKTMTGEEIRLTQALEAEGIDCAETDLGEWIIQLRREGPSHMVMPAIHLSRREVAGLFSAVTGSPQAPDIPALVRVARRELRPAFIRADMGISGANAAVADSGAVALCTNEGNGRLTASLPRLHVTLCGLDKLVPTARDAMRILRVLPRNATGQISTSYVTFVSGAEPGGGQQRHVIFLDNGRRALARDPVLGQALRCVRCGACANVCPVYRLIGGHVMGHIYIGAIGLILTYVFHERERARELARNCINCGACAEVCAAGIDLPGIIQEIRARLAEEDGSPLGSALLAAVLPRRGLFRPLLRLGALAQRPLTGGGPYLRHLPDMLLKSHGFRALPALAARPFRDRWPALARTLPAGESVALFAGCAQDFIYPEQLEAALKVIAATGHGVSFPPEQSCCGLPALAAGERAAAETLALRNVLAFARGGHTRVLTLCASCASHMKHSYPRLLEKHPEFAAETARFVGSLVDFSSFVHAHADLFGSGPKPGAGDGAGLGRAAYHAPCHECRGLGVRLAPRALIAAVADYVAVEEEDLCCGCGGAYSLKFPELSARLLSMKLDAYEAAGAAVLVTGCPGCVMQLRGGAEKQGRPLPVLHMAEFLARALPERSSGGKVS